MPARRDFPIACATALAAALAGAGPAAAGTPPACGEAEAHRKPARAATSDASVADLARLLHGTWVRRLTIGGAPVETNSFWYFDMSRPEAGQGRALMIDRVNQGWDELASAAVRRSRAEAQAGAGDETPATTGAYWSVSIEPAPAEASGRGHSGVTLALAGDYRGTAEQPDGFRFTETGTFYRHGAAFATFGPWRAPPMAAVAEAAPATDAGRYTPVDAVVAEPDNAEGPMLTFVICQDAIVDRYYKISGATPMVQGKSLSEAWESALASGMFKTVSAR